MLATVLVAFGVFVIVEYLSPSDRADSKRSRHDIGTLKIGSYRLDEFKRKSAWEEKVLIIHNWDKKILVYLLPSKDGKIELPDRYWGYGIESCSEFGPESDQLGNIKKDGIIKCHDENIVSGSLWEWTYGGIPLNEYGIKMQKVSYERVGEKIAINR